MSPNRSPAGSADLIVHLRRTVALAWPVMLARAGLLVMALVDVTMIGHVSGPGLAHYGIAMASFLLFMLLGSGLLAGTVVLVAQADGAGVPERTGVVWVLALILAVVVGAAMTLLLAFGPQLLALARQPAALAAAAGEVLRLLGAGMVPLLVYAATSLMLEGLGRPGVGLVIMIGANIINALLNALFLFGPVDLTSGAAAEVALATTLTRWLMAATIVAYVLGTLDRARYGLDGPWSTAPGTFIRLLRLGFPIAGANGLESLAFTVMSLFAGRLGTLEAAAYTVCLNFSALVYMLALGIGTAASVRVGNAVGRRDAPGVARAGWVALGLGLGISASLAPLPLATPERIVGLYTSDPRVAALALPALTLIGALILADALQGILIGALRGAGDVRIPLAIQMSAYLGVAIPVGYVLGIALGLGINGLIIGLVAGLTTAGALLGVRFRQFSLRRLDPV